MEVFGLTRECPTHSHWIERFKSIKKRRKNKCFRSLGTICRWEEVRFSYLLKSSEMHRQGGRQNIKLRFFLPYSIALLLLYPRVTTVVPVHKGNACMPLYFINFCTKSKRARHLCVFVWLIRAVTDIQRFRQNQKEPLG